MYVEILLFLCGSTMGSFLNCICDRMIQKESVLGRSRCPKCFHVLEVIDLIPVFSYLYLKGRCRNCREKIDPFCFYSELSGGVLFVLTFCRFGFCRELPGYLLMVSALLMISLCDAKSMLIPDQTMILLFLTRIAFFFIWKEEPMTFLIRISGSFLFGLFLYAFIYFSERITGKEMMGKGDVILILLLGSFMTITQDILALFLSCLIAMIYGVPLIKKKQFHCLPFTPAICLAYLIMLLYGRQIMYFYFSLFQK